MWRKRKYSRLSQALGLSAGVLLVAHVPAPVHGAARVVDLLHCEMGHEAVRGGAVPVVLAGLEVDAVARPDDFDRAALALAQADALGDEDRLPEGVGVPGGAGAGSEVDAGRRQPRGLRRYRHRVDVDGAGEPVARACVGLERVPRDLHGSTITFSA